MAKRGRHTSLSKEIRVSFKWLENLPEITKIILGRHESCRHRYPPGHMKWQKDTQTGFHLKAYTGDGVQDIFVSIEPIMSREQVKAVIAKRFIN